MFSPDLVITMKPWSPAVEIYPHSGYCAFCHDCVDGQRRNIQGRRIRNFASPRHFRDRSTTWSPQMSDLARVAPPENADLKNGGATPMRLTVIGTGYLGA